MYFDSFHDALVMDGHGAFVWAAYAITALVLLFLLIMPALRSKRLRRELAGNIRRRESAQQEGSHAPRS